MITLRGPALASIDKADPRYAKLVTAQARLSAKDPHLWGPLAAKEAAMRLDWIDLPTTSRALLPELDALAAKFRHVHRVILCGMGGSSLAPEVISKTYKKELFIVDSTDPDYLTRALLGDLSKTIVLVSSKSGTTIETASLRAFFESKFTAAKLPLSEHIVIITDPNSPLDIEARKEGLSVINANPRIGGRFSALGAFGLVPAALLGIDVSILLDSADDAIATFVGSDSPAVEVAYLLAYIAHQYITFCDQDSPTPGLSDWIEQLIAESTGKDQKGRLPVVIDSPSAAPADHLMSIAFAANADLVVQADLGAQFIFWEWVTALIGFALEIDPFNQPNVTETKNQTALLLQKWTAKLPLFTPDLHIGAVEIFSHAAPTAFPTLEGTLENLMSAMNPEGYIAIMAYCDRIGEGALAQLQNILHLKTGRPVTFGWGPRFLHSTAQFHKGAQPNGVFLQITADPKIDIAIPGKDFSFQTLIMAQALGDAQALKELNFPVLRLHLKNRATGVKEILLGAKK